MIPYCRNCTHYRAYYYQRINNYEKLNYGMCSIHKKEQKRNETCEKFKHDELKEKRQKNILYISLEVAAKSINDIIQIIKEKENNAQQ